MDARLIGLWLVRDADMVPDRAVSLIGGLPGELVEFTDDGKYIVWGDPSAPNPTERRCRCHQTDPPGLDVWITGLEGLTSRCIYRIDGAEAQVCIAGDARPRPTEVQRDDGRLWCVVSLERWTGSRPAKGRRSRGRKSRPGKLIPDGFLADSVGDDRRPL